MTIKQKIVLSLVGLSVLASFKFGKDSQNEALKVNEAFTFTKSQAIRKSTQGVANSNSSEHLAPEVRHDKVLIDKIHSIVNDPISYASQMDELQDYCRLNPSICPSFVRQNKLKIFKWSLEKVIVLFRVVIAGADADFSLLDDIISYEPPQEVLHSDHHNDFRQQNINIVKSVAIEEFNKKVENYEVERDEAKKFKRALIEMVKNEQDLMIVRDALLVLTQTFALKKDAIRKLVSHRDIHDRVVYEDLL